MGFEGGVGVSQEPSSITGKGCLDWGGSTDGCREKVSSSQHRKGKIAQEGKGGSCLGYHQIVIGGGRQGGSGEAGGRIQVHRMQKGAR